MQSSSTRGLPRAAQALIVAIAGTVLLLVVAVPGWFGRAHATAQPAPSPVPSGFFRPTAEQWSSLRLEPVKTIVFRPVDETEGKIATDADLTTPIFSPYSGRVTRVFARAGDEVRRGAPLFEMQASEFVQGQADLAAALQALATARAQLRLAERNAARQQALYKIDGAAFKDVEQSRADLAAARDTVRADEAALDAVRNRLGILGKSDAEIRALERGRGAGTKAVVAAPVSGTITERQVSVGEFVDSVANGGSTALFSISDLSRVWLVANVREADVARVRVGEPVAVSVLAYPDRVFHGRVSYVAPGIDPATHRLAVRAEIENSERVLRPEMFASFGIVTGQGTSALAVPEAAVVYEGAGSRVWVAGPDHTLALREIRVGQTRGGMVEVVSGLRPTDEVVTSGSVFIDRAAQGVTQGD